MADETVAAEKLRVFVSYAHPDGKDLARYLAGELAKRGHNVWFDESRLSGGANWSVEIERHIDRCDALVALLSRGSYLSDVCRAEQLRSLRRNKLVIPVLAQKGADRPIHLETRQYIECDGEASYVRVVQRVLDALGSGESAMLVARYRTTYSTVPPLPAHFTARPAELKRLRKLLIGDNTERRIAVTALLGMGGIGKSVLAQMVCSDAAIQDAFPDGTIWATVGQAPTDSRLITQIREIAKVLGDDLTGYDTLQGCGNQFRKTLADKAALIVLDDVWNPRDIQPFLADAPRCRLLLTTRQREVVKATGAVEYSLDVLDWEDARMLLACSSGVESGNLPAEASSIIEESGRLPLALAMIGALVRGEAHDAWARILRRLQAADLDKIRLQFPDYPHGSVLRAIQVSVDSLEPEARSYYLELAVFPDDIPIPAATLQTFWGLDQDDVSELVDAWVGASLANRTDSGIVLHDLQMHYVRKQADDVRGLDYKLVQSYRRRCRGDWASGPDDGYFFAWLPHHLRQLCLEADLRRLLLNPSWMRAKLASGNVAALLSDYDYQRSDPDLCLIQGALRLSAHVLARYPALLTSQLTARLQSVQTPFVREMVGNLRRSECGPWFETTRQTLRPPGGSLLRTLEGHTGGVTAVTVSPDGRWALSGAEDHTLKVWDVERGVVRRTLADHAGGVTAVALTQDGRWAVSGSDNESVQVWDLERGKLIRTMQGHDGPVKALAVSPDGRWIASGSHDGTVKVWDVERGEAIHTLKGHAFGVVAVALTTNGQRAVSGSHDATIRVWDIEEGKSISILKGGSRVVTAVAVTPDGKQAVTACDCRTLKVWDVERAVVRRTLKGHSEWAWSVAITPDGKRAVAAFDDQTLCVWDVERGKVVRTLEGHGAAVRTVAVSADGKRVVSGSDDQTLKVWELDGEEAIPMLQCHRARVGALAMSQDGKRAISGSWDHTLKVWDVDRGEAICKLKGHFARINALAVTQCGERALSASDQTVKVWDVRSRKAIQTLMGPCFVVTALAMTPDGKVAVVGSDDDQLEVWNLEGKVEFRTFGGHGVVTAVALTPDGKRVISGSLDSTLKVWDVERKEAIRTLEGHTEGIRAVALTQDGHWAVSGSEDHSVKLWDVERGEAIRTLEGHADRVMAVALTQDGQRAVSGSFDHTLRLWDLKTGNEIAAFAGESGITACAVAPGGNRFLAGEASGCVHFLKLTNDYRPK